MIIDSNEIGDRIKKMINLLVPVLNSDGAMIGGSAMVDLLVNNAITSGCSKEGWLKDFSNAWDFYEKEQKESESTT